MRKLLLTEACALGSYATCPRRSSLSLSLFSSYPCNKYTACVFVVVAVFVGQVEGGAFCVFELGSALNCKGLAHTQTHTQAHAHTTRTHSRIQSRLIPGSCSDLPDYWANANPNRTANGTRVAGTHAGREADREGQEEGRL